MRKEHILWTAANAQVTQSDREELWRQVKVAMDAGEPLPADAVSKLPSLCAHCGAGGESGGFKVQGRIAGAGVRPHPGLPRRSK